MNAKLFRNLVLFCCTAAAGLVAAAVYCYIAQARWVDQMNSPENVAMSGAVVFRVPEITLNALYIAGLFLALGGCFSLKAAQAASLSNSCGEAEDASPTDDL
jgi:hypothetical protein